MRKITHRSPDRNPLAMHLPLAALASISHRLSGILIFFLLPGILGVLALSLRSEADFTYVVHFLQKPVLKFIGLLFLTAFIFHLLAGIRHLVMDLKCGLSLRSARLSAAGVFMLSGFILAGFIFLFVIKYALHI